MAIEEALIALLSGVAGGRSHWGRAPEGTSASGGAYLRLAWVSGARDYAMDGPTGYMARRLQIDVFAATYGAMRAAAAEAVGVLSGFRGTAEGVRIMGIFVEAERDLDATDAGEVSHLFRRAIDLIVHHAE